MYDFKFADIGEGVHEGVVLKWNYKVGDKVEEGETLVIVETDKVNAELPAPVNGIITKIGAKEGETIHVGETIVVIDDGSGDAKAPAEEDASVSEGTDQGVIGEIEVSSDVMASSDESSGKDEEERPSRALATPVARKLAKDLGVDINTVKGSGENGRVMKSDIEAAAGSSKAKAEPSGTIASMERKVDVPKMTAPDNAETETVPISKLRKAIVKAMTVSKAVIPHTVLFDDVVIDDLVALRNELKEKAANSGVKLTYMPFVIKAVTLALKEHPWFNASFDEENDRMVLKKYYNIGMAVDTKDGLIVPVIKSADRKGIYDLARELDGLATRTRERTVTLDELKGSTFTITNFGVADISYGAPIINYPEVGIIGIGKIQKKAVVVGDEIKVANVLPLSIAVDHRVIDGADAGRFLKTVKSFLADPMMLLLS